MATCNMTINERLNDYVTKNGIKQVYISQKTGISTDAISKMLRSERRIMADEFLEICFALDLDPAIFKESA